MYHWIVLKLYDGRKYYLDTIWNNRLYGALIIDYNIIDGGSQSTNRLEQYFDNKLKQGGRSPLRRLCLWRDRLSGHII